MRRFLKWLLRLGLVAVVLIAGLLAPVAYNELACIPAAKPETYTPRLPPEHRRAESRTLMTYPEWHIVHAYDDYAQVISAGDPHEFGYMQAIGGFWSSLCALSHESAEHGGFTTQSKQTIYVIGVSFTAELLAKAAYEETLGRLAAWWRGPPRNCAFGAPPWWRRFANTVFGKSPKRPEFTTLFNSRPGSRRQGFVTNRAGRLLNRQKPVTSRHPDDPCSLK